VQCEARSSVFGQFPPLINSATEPKISIGASSVSCTYYFWKLSDSSIN